MNKCNLKNKCMTWHRQRPGLLGVTNCPTPIRTLSGHSDRDSDRSRQIRVHRKADLGIRLIRSKRRAKGAS